MGEDEVDLLKDLVASLPASPLVINIGSAAGVSTMAMLEERRDDIFIFSVDPDPGAGEPIELAKAGLSSLNRAFRVLGKSAEFGQHFPLRPDLVFVDGDHCYQGVVEDIHAWLPKVKPGGLLVFHDYHSPLLFDVRKAVDELVRWEVVGDRGTIRAFRAPSAGVD